MRETVRNRWLRLVLVALAAPGLLLLVRDLVLTSPEDVADRVSAWRTTVHAAGERFDVDPSLVLAVIAVESKGDPAARSDRGALGLMQLMPATAREQARRLGLPAPTEKDLLDGDRNVLLGTAYLKAQIERFGGDVELALAAYHAGPTRVSEWVRAWPGRSTKEILERAAFSSTRSYVSSVLAYRERMAARGGRSDRGPLPGASDD